MTRPNRAVRSLALIACGLGVTLALASCDDDDGGDGGPRIVSGVVNESGAAQSGTGFSVSHLGGGGYRVTFDVPFAEMPAVTVTAEWHDSDRSAVAHVYNPSATQFDVRISDTDYPAQFVDRDFHFVVVGQ